MEDSILVLQEFWAVNHRERFNFCFTPDKSFIGFQVLSCSVSFLLVLWSFWLTVLKCSLFNVVVFLIPLFVPIHSLRRHAFFLAWHLIRLMVLLKKCSLNHRLGPKQNNQFLLHPQTPGSYAQENKGRRNSKGFSCSNFLSIPSELSAALCRTPIHYFTLSLGYVCAAQTGNDIFTSKRGLRKETIKSNFQEVITVAVGDFTGTVSPIWGNLLVCLESAEFSWKWTNNRISREISLISWQAPFLECVCRPHRKKLMRTVRKSQEK